jgi:hypothetical protein
MGLAQTAGAVEEDGAGIGVGIFNHAEGDGMGQAIGRAGDEIPKPAPEPARRRPAGAVPAVFSVLVTNFPDGPLGVLLDEGGLGVSWLFRRFRKRTGSMANETWTSRSRTSVAARVMASEKWSSIQLPMKRLGTPTLRKSSPNVNWVEFLNQTL